MEKRIKPIQPTPTLSAKDSKIIIREVRIAPSTQSIERNEKRLLDSKKVFKE